MPQVLDRHPCSFRPCRGEMTLVAREHALAPVERRKRGKKPDVPQGLSAWHCTIEPKRHVEVSNLGIRPLKDCTVPGCGGVMIHWGRVRAVSSLNGGRRKEAPKIVYRSGYVCVDDAEHFQPDFDEA